MKEANSDQTKFIMSGSGGASLTSHERSTKITLQGYSSGNDSDGTESDADREYNKVTCERKQELWSILNTVENEYDKRVEREKGAESFLTYCKKYSHENSPGLLLNCYGPSGLKPLHYLSKVVRCRQSIIYIVSIAQQ